MTPVWAVLGAGFWRRTKKPVYLWYEIKRGSRMLDRALQSVTKVFSATKSGLPEISAKQIICGHGIDTDEFNPDSAKRHDDLIVTVGRVTPIKHHDLLLNAFAELNASYRYVIAGGPITPEDQTTVCELEKQIQTLQIQDRVTMGFRSHTEVRNLLQEATIMLHASGGGLDKVVLEAMACECLVASSSEAAQHVLPAICQAEDATLGKTATHLLALSSKESEALRHELREIVVQHHSLNRLIQKLLEEMRD